MDDLVLNIADTSNAPSKQLLQSKKGGRWTERLKEKRTLKRKVRTEEKSKSRPAKPSKPSQPTQPPRKRPRQDPEPSQPVPSSSRIQSTPARASAPTPSASTSVPKTSAGKRPNQIISSLFSFNPKVNVKQNQKEVQPGAPSNAPLDSSTFPGLGLHPLLTAHLTSKMEIQKPTAIQRASLPVILSTSPEQAARDVFIQSQTGSGKTLAYLLPIIQDLLPLSSLSYIDRSIGTLAVIIAPTRELAKQISDVLEALLKMRLRLEESAEDATLHLTRWLVSGLLVGGSTRAHEKARLRKGVPILVSTPGRLLDHLQNTSSFNVGKCRWLVLDEADQLMQLGFEETIKGIIQGLDGRRGLAKQAMEAGTTVEVGDWDWEPRRRTILCSATLKEDVQKLAGTTLVNPLMVKATEADTEPQQGALVKSQTNDKYTTPSQLVQKYIVSPLKLRLVTLIALLRQIVARGADGTKIVVFLSCTDSVDFHWKIFANTTMGGADASDSDSEPEDAQDKKTSDDKLEAQCSLLPGVAIFRLHGSLPTATRMSVIKGFARSPKNGQPSSSILFCTSVASRGLDLPLVRAVIQYDLPTEGGADEYIHRVGRTARAGQGGEAWSFVAPSESAWPEWLVKQIQGETSQSKMTLTAVPVETVLKAGFNANGPEFEERATEVQLTFERWILRNKQHAELAKQAYLSHMRAYATHPTSEKHIFHIRNLHLGHLAKAFALRDAPTVVSSKAPSTKSHSTSHSAKTPSAKKSSKRKQPEDDNDDSDGDDWTRPNRNNETEQRMKAVVRAQGRLTKKGGVMKSSDVSEFQISSTTDLEKLVRGH